MSGQGTDFVLRHIEGAVLPLASRAPNYVLVELATPRPDAGLRASLETVLERALDDGIVRMRRSRRAKRSARRSGGCARSTPRRRSAKAPA